MILYNMLNCNVQTVAFSHHAHIEKKNILHYIIDEAIQQQTTTTSTVFSKIIQNNTSTNKNDLDDYIIGLI